MTADADDGFSRLEQALARAEAAVARLEERHARLRDEASAALSGIDEVIARISEDRQ